MVWTSQWTHTDTVLFSLSFTGLLFFFCVNILPSNDIKKGSKCTCGANSVGMGAQLMYVCE